MSYIVLDLEWNQAMSSNASVFNRLPIHLSGEIIQIGAVMLGVWVLWFWDKHKKTETKDDNTKEQG